MDTYGNYRLWMENQYFDNDTRNELVKIRDNPAEIEDRFGSHLEFGTGGLRGIRGSGTNRMNKYVVRKTSQGLANYVLGKYTDVKQKGIVVAYDSRFDSHAFAVEAACVFAGNGIKTYLFDELKPVPILSFAVRHLGTVAGVVITASHNTKEYNGYKVYGEDGAQLSIEDSDAVLREIDNIADMTHVNLMENGIAQDRGLLRIIGSDIDDEYIFRIKTLSINPDYIKKVLDTFSIIYTPLHGTGNKPVRRILNEMGFEHVIVVKEQEMPDPEFSTVKSPNPEEKAAFSIAIELAEKENADLIIGTDPDCDRVGVVVKNTSGEYTVLTGNQTGCLLMEYILSCKKAKGELPLNGFTVKTIVTTELARAIAGNYGVELVEVLTGFKFIGEKIKLLDEHGNRKFIFGFEESYGYLAGTFSRDKDGVVTSMLVAEMAACYKARGMSLYEGLQEIFRKYGYFIEGNTSFTLEGTEGRAKIRYTMEMLRKERPELFGDWQAAVARDYLAGESYDFRSSAKTDLTLPRSDVIYYEMKDNSWFCIRPSGTEPKIKIYFGTSAVNEDSARVKLDYLQQNVFLVLNRYLGSGTVSS